MMEKPNYIPADYPAIEVVGSMEPLLERKMPEGKSVRLFPRRLKGDFNELACAVAETTGDPYDDMKLPEDRGKTDIVACYNHLSILGKAAAEAVIADMDTCCRAFSNVSLRVVQNTGYRDESEHFFHQDGLNTLITCYNGPTTEGLRHEDTVSFKQMTKEQWQTFSAGVPSRPKSLLRSRDSSFVFAPVAGAKPFSFEPGDVWLHSGITAPADRSINRFAFIHRAPDLPSGAPPRLLLVCR